MRYRKQTSYKAYSPIKAQSKSGPILTDVWSVTGNLYLKFSRYSSPIKSKIVSICSWSFRAALGQLWYQWHSGVSIKSVRDLTTSAHANMTSVRVAHLYEIKTINTSIIYSNSLKKQNMSVRFTPGKTNVLMIQCIL